MSWIAIAVIVAVAFAVHPNDKDKAILLAMGLVGVLAAIYSFWAVYTLVRYDGASNGSEKKQMVWVITAMSVLAAVFFTFSSAYLLVPAVARWVNRLLDA